MVICTLAAAAVSLGAGLDVNWDLKNYHYYNPFAFVNGRLGWDVAPAQLQTYHNPLGDLPFYYLVQNLASPRLTAAIMALPAGLAAYFLLRIVTALFPEGRSDDFALCIVVSSVIGITGAAGLSVVGSTMNEWPSVMLLAAAIALLVTSTARDGKPSRHAIAAAGVLAGIATGLKLIYGIYAVALLAAAASFGAWPERLKRLTAFGFFTLAGFVLSYGFWGAVLQREFANPFFPYFNSIFKSPWWEPVNFFDRRFGPHDMLSAIAFPLYFASESKLVSEVRFRDWRLPVLFLVSAACLVYFILRHAVALRPASRTAQHPVSVAWRLVAVFTCVAYALWLKLFGIYRYAVPLELFSGALIVGGLLYLIPGKTACRIVVVMVAIVLLATTRVANWGRIGFGETYFNVAAPAIPAGSIVILGSNEPMSYAIPSFRPDARFVSPDNNFLHRTQRNLLAQKIAAILAAHNGPILVLDHWNQKETEATLAYYGLARDARSCRGVRSNLDASAMRVCGVARIER